MIIARTARRGLVGMLCVLAVLCVLGGCTAGPPPTGRTPVPTAWPPPWAQRPVVDLSFDVAADLRTVRGAESVAFTPDREVCELVFRAWPNKPTTARTGSSMRVTAAAVDGAPVAPRVVAAGAPDGAPGTLVEIPLPGCVPAGRPLRADLAFELVLGRDAGERMGYSESSGIAWFATAYPLLSWVRGIGWARDPAVDLFGETVTSEEFRLADLTVTADADQEVLGTGAAVGTDTPVPGRVAHRFTADSVRDVAVSVGRLDVLTREVGGVRLHVGTPTTGTRIPGADWAAEIGTQLDRLSRLLGPYPYPDLWATVVPPQSDGVEFPGVLQFGDRRGDVAALVAHEVAHQWFYALVGNNQARDPWIDESFATYAQAVVTGQEDEYELSDIPDRLVGELGRPMSFWAERGDFERYVRGVYDQGAAVLLAGRREVGPDRFDAAVRAYLQAHAHGVARPEDVERAFRDLPEVVDRLRERGALG